MNNDLLIKTIIADLLAFAVPLKFDELAPRETYGGYGIQYFDSEERDYAQGAFDTLIDLIDKVREDLSTKVFEFAETLAKEILERHPDWAEFELGDLEHGDPWLQHLEEEYEGAVDGIVDDFYLDLISGN